MHPQLDILLTTRHTLRLVKETRELVAALTEMLEAELRRTGRMSVSE